MDRWMELMHSREVYWLWWLFLLLIYASYFTPHCTMYSSVTGKILYWPASRNKSIYEKLSYKEYWFGFLCGWCQPESYFFTGNIVGGSPTVSFIRKRKGWITKFESATRRPKESQPKTEKEATLGAESMHGIRSLICQSSVKVRREVLSKVQPRGLESFDSNNWLLVRKFTFHRLMAYICTHFVYKW